MPTWWRTAPRVLSLLVEGLESAWLPCSLILLVPGAATVLAARENLVPALAGFGLASLALAWLRFSDRGGDWPVGVAAIALIGATVLLLVPLVEREQLLALGGGALAGGAAAELWEPCVGSAFGQLLNQLPGRGASGLVLLLVYLAGVLSPLVGLAAIVELFPRWLLDPARSALAVIGGAVLAVMSVATAVGLHDDIVGRLILWSL